MAVTDAHDTTTAPDPGWPGRSAGLSKRESDVLALLAQGLTNREIAKAVFLSPETVKGYVAQIYSKLGVRNRVEASRFVHCSVGSTASPGLGSPDRSAPIATGSGDAGR